MRVERRDTEGTLANTAFGFQDEFVTYFESFLHQCDLDLSERELYQTPKINIFKNKRIFKNTQNIKFFEFRITLSFTFKIVHMI